MTTAVTTSLDLTRATDRAPLGPTAEGLSGASFEGLTLDGEKYVVKRLSRDTDWVMRAAHDTDVPYAVRMFRGGVFDQLRGIVDTGFVDVAYDPGSGATELLMRDLSSTFLRDENEITAEQHATILTTMARMHATTFGWADTIGMAGPGVRYGLLAPAFARREVLRGPLVGVPSVLEPMWARFAEVAPEAHAILEPLANDPSPLAAALAASPRCLVHGDFKGGNLGLHPDGLVVLVDWAFPGIDAPLSDVMWYLSVNCDRLPETKERTLDRYRTSLEAQGISTDSWWDQQLPLAVIGGAVQMAWNKCDQPEELAWWTEQVLSYQHLLP